MDEYAKIVRSMIEHENNLTDHRVKWMLTAQGLLFTALAFALKDAPMLVKTLCFLGIAVAIATILNVYFATRAVERLILWWNENGRGYTGPPIIGLDVKPGRISNFLSPANLLSIALIVGWLVILCDALCTASN